jgi:hypothetical protein
MGIFGKLDVFQDPLKPVNDVSPYSAHSHIQSKPVNPVTDRFLADWQPSVQPLDG